MVVSMNRGLQYRPQNAIILIIGTPKKVPPLILGNLRIAILGVAKERRLFTPKHPSSCVPKGDPKSFRSRTATLRSLKRWDEGRWTKRIPSLYILYYIGAHFLHSTFLYIRHTRISISPSQYSPLKKFWATKDVLNFREL